MNTQQNYDDMGKVSRKLSLNNIVVAKPEVEFNMGTHSFEDRSRLKVWRRYYHETYQCSTQSSRDRYKNNLRYVAKT